MGLIETLSKEYPVPYKRTRDMSESEYMKLVDRNTDLLDENKTLKEEIERLNNIIKEVRNWVKSTIDIIEQQPTGNDDWILERLNSFISLLDKGE